MSWESCALGSMMEESWDIHVAVVTDCVKRFVFFKKKVYLNGAQMRLLSHY